MYYKETEMPLAQVISFNEYRRKKGLPILTRAPETARCPLCAAPMRDGTGLPEGMLTECSGGCEYFDVEQGGVSKPL